MTVENQVRSLRQRTEFGIGDCWKTTKQVSDLLQRCGVPHKIVCGGIEAQLEGVEENAEDCKAVGSNHYWIETWDGTTVETHSESEDHYGEMVFGPRPDNYVVFDDSVVESFGFVDC